MCTVTARSIFFADSYSTDNETHLGKRSSISYFVYVFPIHTADRSVWYYKRMRLHGYQGLQRQALPSLDNSSYFKY